jgi:hypothetical protein
MRELLYAKRVQTPIDAMPSKKEEYLLVPRKAASYGFTVSDTSKKLRFDFHVFTWNT